MARYFADTAALLSDPGRAAILMALIDGRVLPAGELAMIANVAPQTASSHLSKLVGGHLLRVEQQGRHRYYRLADTNVAHAIEALLVVTSGADARSTSSTRPASPELVYARSCYSHLAGQLAVQIADALQHRGVLTGKPPKQFVVSDHGREWFNQLGIELTERQVNDSNFARRCLDWTERRHHIAGPLGSAMLTRFLELKWIARLRDSRAVRVTHEGERRFSELLKIVPPNLKAVEMKRRPA